MAVGKLWIFARKLLDVTMKRRQILSNGRLCLDGRLGDESTIVLISIFGLRISLKHIVRRHKTSHQQTIVVRSYGNNVSFYCQLRIISLP